MGNTWKSETFNYFISKGFLETEYDTEQNNVLSSLWENRCQKEIWNWHPVGIWYIPAKYFLFFCFQQYFGSMYSMVWWDDVTICGWWDMSRDLMCYLRDDHLIADSLALSFPSAWRERSIMWIPDWVWCCVCVCVQLLSHKLCSTLSDLMDCSPSGLSVYGISWPRILECVVISFSGGSSRLRIEPMSPALADRLFTTEPPGKSLMLSGMNEI